MDSGKRSSKAKMSAYYYIIQRNWYKHLSVSDRRHNYFTCVWILLNSLLNDNKVSVDDIAMSSFTATSFERYAVENIAVFPDFIKDSAVERKLFALPHLDKLSPAILQLLAAFQISDLTISNLHT
ncbi:hypothetical protein BTVI_84050 [Pitangus sulphuratus]|nr:hypothetical protein BTVI_84050 [Pitangus sulphuratus]